MPAIAFCSDMVANNIFSSPYACESLSVFLTELSVSFTVELGGKKKITFAFVNRKTSSAIKYKFTILLILFKLHTCSEVLTKEETNLAFVFEQFAYNGN